LSAEQRAERAERAVRMEFKREESREQREQRERERAESEQILPKGTKNFFLRKAGKNFFHFWVKFF